MKPQRILVLGEGESKGKGEKAAKPLHLNLIKSLRNIPKKDYAVVSQLNGYALARCQHLVVLESALDQFLSILGVTHE